MYTCACPPPCETVSGMMIARIETSRRLQDNWIEQVEDHKIIREEVPRYKLLKFRFHNDFVVFMGIKKFL